MLNKRNYGITADVILIIKLNDEMKHRHHYYHHNHHCIVVVDVVVGGDGNAALAYFFTFGRTWDVSVVCVISVCLLVSVYVDLMSLCLIIGSKPH